jgi:hypothetical protein
MSNPVVNTRKKHLDELRSRNFQAYVIECKDGIAIRDEIVNFL